MKFEEYLNEAGKYVRELQVHPSKVKDIFLKFLTPKFVKIKGEDEYGYKNTVSKQKVREYLEEFLHALMTQGAMSHAGKEVFRGKVDLDKSNMGTAVWAINLMKEMGLDTNKRGNIEKFEKELTTYSIKVLNK